MDDRLVSQLLLFIEQRVLLRDREDLLLRIPPRRFVRARRRELAHLLSDCHRDRVLWRRLVRALRGGAESGTQFVAPLLAHLRRFVLYDRPHPEGLGAAGALEMCFEPSGVPWRRLVADLLDDGTARCRRRALVAAAGDDAKTLAWADACGAMRARRALADGLAARTGERIEFVDVMLGPDGGRGRGRGDRKGKDDEAALEAISDGTAVVVSVVAAAEAKAAAGRRVLTVELTPEQTLRVRVRPLERPPRGVRGVRRAPEGSGWRLRAPPPGASPAAQTAWRDWLGGLHSALLRRTLEARRPQERFPVLVARTPAVHV